MAQFPANIDLSSLDGSNGFRLSGVAASDQSGRSVASAGDVNGDGFADLIVGAPFANANGRASGASYVVFGQASGFAANVALSSLDGSNGFRLSGVAADDQSGRSVASAGDVNGDGFADLIVGARYADPNGSDSGASYVVFGRASGFGATLDLSSLDGSNGFRLSGAAAGDQSGFSVASAGDVNGDRFADLIVGARDADPHGSDSGASYVVFGQASGFAANLDLSSLDGSNGFRLSGVAASDWSGHSVASAGDVNGDGFADLIVGAPLADPNGSYSGASYVVFGQASGFGANLDLSSLDGSNGFRLSGVAAFDQSGPSVASAGDVNGDGFADLIVGAPSADPNGSASGASYVVFGQASGFGANLALSSLDGSNGFRLSGAAAVDQSGYSVASAGDVNGDGFADLIVGAPSADPNGSASGASYVVFGRASGFGATFDLSSLDGSNGFRLSGVAAVDGSSFSVASAGDVNGDGFADLIVGAPFADPNGTSSGASYVVFGRAPDTAVVRFGTVASQTLAGSAFDDTLSGLGGDDELFGHGGGDTLRGASGDDLIKGGDGNDQLLGSVGDDRLDGGAGDDVLNGGTGADVMVGGDGNDSYVVDDTQDVVEETGDGRDRVSTSVDFALDAGEAIEILTGRGTASLTLTGNELHNVIWGGAGGDTIDGGLANDNLRGKGGDDTLVGGAGNDVLEGGAGADRFGYALGDGNDRLTDFDGAAGDRVALTGVTVSQLVSNIATLSDGSTLRAQAGYLWANTDFTLV